MPSTDSSMWTLAKQAANMMELPKFGHILTNSYWRSFINVIKILFLSFVFVFCFLIGLALSENKRQKTKDKNIIFITFINDLQ